MTKKRIYLRFRKVNKDIFDAIKRGKKKIETRAATIRYRNIKVGDTVVLVCGKSKFEKQVKSVEVFETVVKMLKKYGPKEINPFVSSVKELKQMYDSFPDYREKIKKYGLIAFELK